MLLLMSPFTKMPQGVSAGLSRLFAWIGPRRSPPVWRMTRFPSYGRAKLVGRPTFEGLRALSMSALKATGEYWEAPLLRSEVALIITKPFPAQLCGRVADVAIGPVPQLLSIC